jgi:hypothetical protein
MTDQTPNDGTAFARLTTMLAKVDAAGGLEDIIEFPPGPVDAGPDIVELILIDVAVVLARLADLCPDHSECVSCHRVMCPTCGIGGDPSCPHDWPLVCDSCDPTDTCGECYIAWRAAATIRRTA